MMFFRGLIHLLKAYPWRSVALVLAIIPVISMLSSLSSHRLKVGSLPEPLQEPLAHKKQPLALHGWSLHPLATFKLEARVLSTKHYKGDEHVRLSPFDFALGWGPMADPATLSRLEITQSDRYYRWQWWGAPPLGEADLIRHSTNAHLIPANDDIALALSAVKKGDLIQITGKLVEATHPNANKPWRSSLTRDDRGEGACEIILVESLQHISGRSGNL